jgi:hypothetical protein
VSLVERWKDEKTATEVANAEQASKTDENVTLVLQGFARGALLIA